MPTFFKGHVNTNLSLLEKRLIDKSKDLGEKYLKIIQVNEFRTTKLCNKCNEKLFISRKETEELFVKIVKLHGIEMFMLVTIFYVGD